MDIRKTKTKTETKKEDEEGSDYIHESENSTSKNQH